MKRLRMLIRILFSPLVVAPTAFCLAPSSSFGRHSLYNHPHRAIPSTTRLPSKKSIHESDSMQRHQGGIALAFLVTLASAATQASALTDSSYVVSTSNYHPNMVRNQPVSQSASSFFISAFGAPPSGLGGTSYETLDFSMPSYDEAVKGGAEPKLAGPPSFTATFSDETLPSSNVSSEKKDDSKDMAMKEAEEKVAKKIAEENTKAAAKLAEEEKAKAAAEEKAVAAAEKKAADEERMALEAEKKSQVEARKAAEKQKQLEMIERNKVTAEETVKVTLSEGLKKESSQESSEPVLSLPQISAPSLEMKIPELPELKLPSFSVPKLDLPKIDVPNFDVPKLEVPKLDLTLPTFEGFDSETSSEMVEPQEVRDQRAREAKLVYLEKFEVAKEMAKQARAAREVATEAKQSFNAAKDEACKTRLGGKYLCVRPWWNIGY